MLEQFYLTVLSKEPLQKIRYKIRYKKDIELDLKIRYNIIRK